MREERVAELDGLRGLACLLVVVWHYIDNLLASSHSHLLATVPFRVLSVTWSGVDLFFVLSGFLLGGRLIDHRQSKGVLKTFYVRRACRILPAYFAALVLYFGLVHVLPATYLSHWMTDSTGTIPTWSYFAFVQNLFMAKTGDFGFAPLSITWSLSIEEQFYLVLPALVLLANPKRLPLISILIVLLTPILRLVMLYGFKLPTLSAYVMLFARWDALFLGVLGAHLVRAFPEKMKLRETRVWLRSLLIVMGLGIWLYSINFPRGVTLVLAAIGYTWISAFYLCLLLLGLFDPAFSRVFRWKPLVSVGVISYGIYLLHQISNGLVHGIIRNADPNIVEFSDLAVVVLTFMLTVSTAWISYRFFELPIIRLGKRVKWGK
jgi:peptidoglycan/LPS O-acetylase OafA/YrhL